MLFPVAVGTLRSVDRLSLPRSVHSGNGSSSSRSSSEEEEKGNEEENVDGACSDNSSEVLPSGPDASPNARSRQRGQQRQSSVHAADEVEAESSGDDEDEQQEKKEPSARRRAEKRRRLVSHALKKKSDYKTSRAESRVIGESSSEDSDQDHDNDEVCRLSVTMPRTCSIESGNVQVVFAGEKLNLRLASGFVIPAKVKQEVVSDDELLAPDPVERSPSFLPLLSLDSM